MNLCPCTRGRKRERCSCKNYEKVALEGGSIFNEAMYTCTCQVGKIFNKCDNSNHIQALDYRAATWEALNQLDRARKDAEWILELAPRLPDVCHFLLASFNLLIHPGISASGQDCPPPEELRVCLGYLQCRHRGWE